MMTEMKKTSPKSVFHIIFILIFHIMMEPTVRLVVKTPCMLVGQADRHCKAWVLSRLSLWLYVVTYVEFNHQPVLFTPLWFVISFILLNTFGQAWQIYWLYVNLGQEKSTSEQIGSGWEDEKKRGVEKTNGSNERGDGLSPDQVTRITSAHSNLSIRQLRPTSLCHSGPLITSLWPFDHVVIRVG